MDRLVPDPLFVDMQGAKKGDGAMYTLADFGSFHVSGRMVEVSGQQRKTIAFTPGMTYEHDPKGRFLVEQVCVQYFVPVDRRFEIPLTLLHRGGLTGVTWENTPDGRPGWLHELVRQGFAVNVIDNVERGPLGVLPDQWCLGRRPARTNCARGVGSVPFRITRKLRCRQTPFGPTLPGRGDGEFPAPIRAALDYHLVCTNQRDRRGAPQDWTLRAIAREGS